MEDVKQLWREFGKTRTPELRDRIIVSYLPLVKYVLGRISLYLPPHLDSEDLTESGIIGLIRAVQEFDLSREIEFTTFAVPRIRGAILDELRSHDWVPRSARKKASMLEGAYVALFEKSNRPPSTHQLAKQLGLSEQEVEKMASEVSFASFLSLEGLRGSNDDGQVKMIDSIANERSNNPLAMLETDEEIRALAQAISLLPYQERVVITLYYYQGLMLKEIARLLKLSKSRVSQIHNKAVVILRAKIRSMMTPTLETASYSRETSDVQQNAEV
jgi:RNA polymerase sigma factor for flagellar operon FliA